MHNITCAKLSSVKLTTDYLALKMGYLCGTSSLKSESHDIYSALVSGLEHMNITDHVRQCPTFPFFADLSPYMSDSHVTLHTYTSGQDHVTTVIHVWTWPIFLLH